MQADARAQHRQDVRVCLLAPSGANGRGFERDAAQCAVPCCAVLPSCMQARGPEALQDHPIQPLAWEEVQGLAGGVVGLPLGYTPAAAAAVLPPPAPSSSAEKRALPGCEAPAECDGGAAAGLQLASQQQGWVRGAGWTRAQYVQQALSTHEACRGAAAEGV